MNMDINGLDINYKISGPEDAAHTMVILQGWGTGMEIYDSVAAAVNDRYRVVQFDLPGFGASDEPREPWNVDAYADFFCSFMEALGIKRAVLLGHSYGGRVIIKLAAKDSLPFEIEKIVLVDSAGVMPERSASQKFKVRLYKIKRTFLMSK
ncbi:MAG: alpha/beta hydrolase, partial [Clostridiales bacterium]|nr:alpha/beta hydrolase [Clostridiales bacterium]